MIEPPDAPLGFAALPGELRARVEAELAPGERLFWASPAGPKPEAALLSPIKPGLVGLMALMIGLVLFWVSGQRIERPGRDTGLPVALGLLAIIASMIAFLGALGAWWQRRTNRRPDRRQSYALTERRLIIWEPKDRAGGVVVVTIEPRSVREVHRLEYPDGSGEVRISFVAENRDFGTWPPRSLIGITEVRRVEALARSVMIGPGIAHFATQRPPEPGHDPFHDLDEPEEPF